MKVRHLALPAIAALILSGAAPVVWAARLNSSQIQFHPTLLSELAIPATPATTGSAEAQVTPLSGMAEPAGESDTLLRYGQMIDELELEEGIYAPSLREPLLALATEYLEAGNPQAALEGLERAMQITRVHEGLNSIEQVAVLRTMIGAYVELGDLPNAHRLQEAMLHVQVRHFGRESVESVPALLEWADWNVNLYLSDERQDGVSLQDTLAHGSSTMDYANPFVQEAYARYVSALEILHLQPKPHESLVTIERKLAALNFMVDEDMLEMLEGSETLAGDEPGAMDSVTDRVRNFHFSNGDSALKRALAYGYLSPEPDHDYIAARMLELADWNLLFDHRGAALELYQETLEFLARSNLPQHEIDRFFAAGLPVKTPDTAYQQEQSPEAFTGYIDVEVKLSKYGSASDTRLLAESDADPAVVDELFRTIRNCKFRPVLAQGNTSSADTVQLRYFYTVL